jgi:HTH-type transcriptional regulator/antitoxin HigA
MMNEQEFMPDWFSKPGDSLRALMLRQGLTAQDVARYLHGGMSALRSLLDGTGTIDELQATVLANHLGGSVSFWLDRQANYEVALERAVDRATAIEGDDWLLLRVPGDKPRGRLSAESRRSEIRRRLTFFGVGTLKAWEARYGRICSDTLYRKSEAFTSDNASILMWLRCGELGADLVSTRPWNSRNLQDRLGEIRKLSKVRRPDLFLPRLKAICAEAGVAVVAKRAPEGCPASGASRIVAPNKAMILLSFRGLSDDQFWFTVFHEIGHLLLHSDRTFVDSDMDGVNEFEREANEFALRCIIPEQSTEEFEQLMPAKEDVIRFSVKLGVSPGLIVGQMQYRKMIRQDQLNYLKRRWKWNQLEHLLEKI